MKHAVAIAGLLVTLSSQAAARPSLWQKARDPKTAQADEVAREIERLLGWLGEADGPDVSRRFADSAVDAGRLGHAEELPGARVQCLFGIALTEAGLYRKAHRVFERALAERPEGALAGRCYYAASIAAAHLGHTDLEIATLTRSIELDSSENQLANAYCNRAEAWMRRGDMARAIADYEQGIDLGYEPAQQALCYYGLAVALDRNGDTPSAWQALGVALQIQLPLHVYASQDALDLPNVFYLPAHEIHYYKALSRMAAARQASDDDERRERYERALKHWQAYLAGGEKTADPWLTQARLHAATCRRLIEEAEKKTPPRPKRGPKPKPKIEDAPTP